MASKDTKAFVPNGPGTLDGPTLPVAGAWQEPNSMDTGAVEDGPVEFANWKGEADKPSAPPPAPSAPDARIGFAVVGLGRLALEQILPAFSSCRYARLAGLVSGSPDKRNAVASQYGVP